MEPFHSSYLPESFGPSTRLSCLRRREPLALLSPGTREMRPQSYAQGGGICECIRTRLEKIQSSVLEIPGSAFSPSQCKDDEIISGRTHWTLESDWV